MRQVKSLLVLLLAVCLAGCAAKEAPPFAPEFKPLTMREGYRQKAENFLILLDASSSMDERYLFALGTNKIDAAKETILNMNKAIPELRLKGGLRTFGPVRGSGKAAEESSLVYGMAAYEREQLAAAVNGVSAAGMTPLAKPLAAAGGDLQALTGRMAVILISDGVNSKEGNAVAEARALKEQFGDRLCLYTILMGDDPAGKKLLEEIAVGGGCGFATTANNLESGERMADFVERVFFEKAKGQERADSDSDGVFDDRDLCPGTPHGVAVDATGCPPDADGDGVCDYLDRCPGTMVGMKVDASGCPPAVVTVRLQVEFDFNKDEVRPGYHQQLRDFANFMKANPLAKAVLEGHTDNIGSDSYNLDLSSRRAESVKAYLVGQLGVDADRLQAKGYGAAKPVAPNDTEEGRQQNRRVVAVIETGSSR
ncbi:MAG: OmpA family protein [Desulfobulbaceae bacterium]|nr:OmpA family protein [Desulfobulbaceae bacterium]